MIKDDPKRAAKALILFKGRYLLLLRNDKEDFCPSEWDMPGGGAKSGETVNETLIREVKEETGIDISSSKVLPINNWIIKKERIEISGTDFLCILKKSQKITLSPEHVRAEWFSKKEIIDSKEVSVWLKKSVELAAAKLNKL